LLGGILVVLSCTAIRLAESAKLRAHSHTHANPIRKVIRLLQAMDEKVREEGKNRQKLFDKYMCYCTSSEESLSKSIATAEEKLPQLQSGLKEASAEHSQLREELKQHKTERSDAQKAMTTSKALGEKELQTLGAEETELKENIKALGRAAEAVQKGMGGFLQTSAAKTLQKLSLSMDMATADRDALAAFLVGESGADEPQSGEILGILKEMYDQMSKDLQNVQSEITTTTNNLENLVMAKEKEVSAASKAIESKTAREGELAVDIATLKHDVADVSETLENDQTFLVDLKKGCQVKQDECKDYQTIQSQELIALSETVKLLNDDDALELFKKTLPSPAASFVESSPPSFLQMKATARGFRRRAVASLRAASTSDPRYDLLELAVRGEAQGFEKIIAMIDDLNGVLRQEQTEDDRKKTFCLSEIDKTEDEHKLARRAVSDTKATIADRADSLDELTFAIGDMVAGIKELDQQVADATAARQKEHAQSVQELAENSAAKGLLEVARNRLRKFYNAKLFKAPKKDEDGVELLQHGFQQPQPPEADLSYKKKTEEHGGVVAMINMLREDLVKKITIMETEEKAAQSDYEKYVEEVTKKRALDSKALSDKEGEKAEIEASLHEDKETLSDHENDVSVSRKEMTDLHQECDWFLTNFELRRNARIDEVDALSKAKAVLSGADFS